MKHQCKITVLETKVFPDLQEKYLADPKSGPCPCFKVGDEFILDRTSQKDDFYHLMNGQFCGEAWDAVSRYVYTALQGGSIMHGWTNDERMMIACCNDGTRPVIFKIEISFYRIVTNKKLSLKYFVDMFPTTRTLDKKRWICSRQRSTTKKSDMTFLLSSHAMSRQSFS